MSEYGHWVKAVGEPDAGNPPVRLDEGAVETGVSEKDARRATALLYPISILSLVALLALLVLLVVPKRKLKRLGRGKMNNISCSGGKILDNSEGHVGRTLSWWRLAMGLIREPSCISELFGRNFFNVVRGLVIFGDPRLAYSWSALKRAQRLLKSQGFLVKDFTNEIANDFVKVQNEVLSEERARGYAIGGIPRQNELILYSLIRSLNPEIVIETGVAAGVSSYFILSALRKNAKGKLYSIDLPNNISKRGYINSDGRLDGVFTPVDRGTGWIVPELLRDRWALTLGDSMTVLENLAVVPDLFYHDSDHSSRVMKYEFNWAVNRGAIVVASDDIKWNRSWSEFEPPEMSAKVSIGGFGLMLIHASSVKTITRP